MEAYFSGLNKENFEKWMKPNPLEHGRYGQLITNTFDNMPFSLQQGVYLEYLDSVGCNIAIFRSELNQLWLGYFTNQDSDLDPCNTRQEALTEAFKKADELINANT